MKEKEARELEMRQQLERYMSGALTTTEVDRLWAEILQNPAWLDELEADAAARVLIQAKRSESTGSESNQMPSPSMSGSTGGGGSSPGIRRPALHWVTATIVTVLMVTGIIFWRTDQTELIPDRIDLSEMITPDIYRDNQRGYDDVDVWINEGLALALMERPTEALEAYNSMLQRELTGVQLDAVRLNLAILYYNDGDYDRARTEMNRFLDHTHEERPNRLTGKAWWILGLNQRQLGDLEGANASFRRALSHDQVHRDRIERWIEPQESD